MASSNRRRTPTRQAPQPTGKSPERAKPGDRAEQARKIIVTLLLASLPSPPSPVMFEVGPFALRYYGLCIALGIVVATWLTGRELERKGMDGTLALDSLFFIVPLGFIGARAYHVATDYELYAGDPFPGVFAVWNGGLGIYGGVVGRVHRALDLRPRPGHKPVGFRRCGGARAGPRPGDRTLGQLLQPGAFRTAFGPAVGHPHRAREQARRVHRGHCLSPHVPLRVDLGRCWSA